MRKLAAVFAAIALTLVPGCGDDEESDDAAPAVTITEETGTGAGADGGVSSEGGLGGTGESE